MIRLESGCEVCEIEVKRLSRTIGLEVDSFVDTIFSLTVLEIQERVCSFVRSISSAAAAYV